MSEETDNAQLQDQSQEPQTPETDTSSSEPTDEANIPASDSDESTQTSVSNGVTETPDTSEPTADSPAPTDDSAPACEPEPEPDTEASEPIDLPEDLDQRVEAALLTASQTMNSNRVGQALGGIPGKIVTEAIARLNESYAETSRSFRIEQVAGGWRIMTLPEFGDVLAGISKQKNTEAKLRPAQLETLAIVAYKQPVTRVDVEMIRGVACGEVLRSLMDRHLVKVVGRADEIGRPMLYGTTKKFLEIFGLNSTKDLPNVEEMKLD